jgi:hypothetical protein
MPTAVWTNGTGFSLQMSRVSRGIHLIVTKECLDDRENAQCCFESRVPFGGGDVMI